MASTSTKIVCAAALMICLSGCIMYVAPNHRSNAPRPDEKPAPTVDKSKI